MASSVRVDTDARPDKQTVDKKTADKPGLVTRLRRRYPWLDHVMRALDAYTERYGAHYAAAITYFSVLSLFPIVLLAFSVMGFVLHGNMALQGKIEQGIHDAVPAGPLQGLISMLISTVDKSRGGTGIVGIVLALYSGVGWMGNLRNALTAQWGLRKPEALSVSMVVGDLAALVGLGIALVVSFGLTALSRGFAGTVLRLLGFAGQAWAQVLLAVVGIVLSVAANWLVFMWVIVRLPREKVPARTAVRGALLMAVGFEVLKQVMTIYLKSLQSQPTFALFGPILGLMIFANFVSQLLLFITAWTATARQSQQLAPVEDTGSTVVRPIVGVSAGPSGGQAAGLLGAGAVLALLLGRRRR